MSTAENFANLVGNWAGSSQLWMMPGEPAHDSHTAMTVSQGSRSGFTTLRYTWTEGGEDQEGLLVLGPLADPNAIHAVWIDTFHMPATFMPLVGVIREDGTLVLKGSYAAPPGPDWGWQIRIPPPSGDHLQLIMDNISPEGEEYLSVEAKYSRR